VVNWQQSAEAHEKPAAHGGQPVSFIAVLVKP
jgi:hypothetical protein